jgi:RNA recognition motif-containing protein
MPFGCFSAAHPIPGSQVRTPTARIIRLPRADSRVNSCATEDDTGIVPIRRSMFMTGKLYVGNLPSSATEAQLQAKFGQFGRVIAVEVATDATTGRSKRSGYVEMETNDQAQAAINRLNMTQYDDVVISVSRIRLKQIA